MTATSQGQHVVPRWAPATSLVTCLLGLLDAAYLTYEHYTASTALACSDTGAINCLKVTTSSYATIAGLPVALLGLVFFTGMTVLCLPIPWQNPSPAVRRTRLAPATNGVLSVLYLLWAELLRLNAICLWCTGVHVLTFVLFAVVLLTIALSPQPAASTR